MASPVGDREQQTVLEIVESMRPEERFLASDYFDASLRRRFLRGSPVDFGLEADLNLITPAVTMVVMWAFGVVKGEAQPALEERLRKAARKVFKIKDPAVPPELPTPTTPAHGSSTEPDLTARLVTLLTDYGVDLGLPRLRAEMLAELAVAKAQDATR